MWILRDLFFSFQLESRGFIFPPDLWLQGKNDCVSPGNFSLCRCWSRRSASGNAEYRAGDPYSQLPLHSLDIGSFSGSCIHQHRRWSMQVERTSCVTKRSLQAPYPWLRCLFFWACMLTVVAKVRHYGLLGRQDQFSRWSSSKLHQALIGWSEWDALRTDLLLVKAVRSIIYLPLLGHNRKSYESDVVDYSSMTHHILSYPGTLPFQDANQFNLPSWNDLVANPHFAICIYLAAYSSYDVVGRYHSQAKQCRSQWHIKGQDYQRFGIPMASAFSARTEFPTGDFYIEFKELNKHIAENVITKLNGLHCLFIAICL